MRTRPWCTIALLLLPCGLAAAADSLDNLLAQLKRPVPSTVAFVEVRESKLLVKPLRVRGELRHGTDGTLERVVTTPFKEHTTIRGDRVRIVRGESNRRFALDRAPELRALLASFRAMLEGKRALLEQHYTVELTQAAPRWTIRLAPKAPARNGKIVGLALHGSSNELECVDLRQADGGRSQMLLGAAAAPDTPAFDTHCTPAVAP